VKINAAHGFYDIGVLRIPKIDSGRLKEWDLFIKFYERGKTRKEVIFIIMRWRVDLGYG
jgi:hypothetical protein